MINKFKIGDKVRRRKECKGEHWKCYIDNNLGHCSEDSVFEIVKIVRERITLCVIIGQARYEADSIFEERFELIVSNDEDMKGGNENMMFEIGQKVRRICGKQKGMKVGDYAVVNSVGETCVILEGYRGEHLKSCLEVVGSSCCKGKMDIETLKTFNKKNLVEGKKQAETDKANYEATESRNAYKRLVDRKEEQERIIRVAEEELTSIKDDLKLFSK